jgi:hypothetical protein
MPTCVLHVGMPKTGTTSIQESLFHGLKDPRFQFVSLGNSNAVAFLEPLFGDDPEGFWVHRRTGASAENVRRRVHDADRRLRAALRRAGKAAATAILSAERCWAFSASSLERLRDYVSAEGFDVRVIAYLRPLKSWLESSFQQEAKLLNKVFDLGRLAEDVRARRSFWYTQRLSGLDHVFGHENITVRLFARHALVGGCVVRDLCTTLGVDFKGEDIIRTNESISADAVRMLCCFHRFHPGASRLSLWSAHLLVKRLESLGGPPFRFHSSLLAPLADEIAAQEREIRERYGVDIHQKLRESDADLGIRDESDLWRFPRASLDWLAGASGQPRIVVCEGEATARQVAKQVAVIASRPSVGLRLEFLRYRMRRTTRWIRHGD